MNNSFKYQKEGVARDLAELLVKEYNWTISKALDVLYDSETYSKICNPNTGLFFQGSLYLFSILKEEIENGKIA